MMHRNKDCYDKGTFIDRNEKGLLSFRMLSCINSFSTDRCEKWLLSALIMTGIIEFERLVE